MPPHTKSWHRTDYLLYILALQQDQV